METNRNDNTPLPSWLYRHRDATDYTRRAVPRPPQRRRAGEGSEVEAGPEVPFSQAVQNRLRFEPITGQEVAPGAAGRNFVRGLFSPIRATWVLGEEGLDRVFGEGEVDYMSELMDRGTGLAMRQIGQMFGNMNRILTATAREAMVGWRTGGAFGEMGRAFSSTLMGPEAREAFMVEDARTRRRVRAEEEQYRQMLLRGEDPDPTRGLPSYMVNPVLALEDYFYGLERDELAQYVQPTGVLGEDPEGWDYLDPRRAAQMFLSQVPSLGAMAASRYLGGPIGFASFVGGSSAEDYLQNVEQWEQETGQEVDPFHAIAGATATAAATVLLERIGLDAIGQTGRIASSSLRRQMAARLLLAPVGEGITESLQTYTNNALHLSYRDAPFSAYVSDEMMYETLHAFYGGVVVGGGAGAILHTASARVGQRPDAELIEFSPDDDGVLQPRFRLRGATDPVGLEELQSRGLTPPPFRRDLLREQFVQGREGFTREQVDVALRLAVDYPAQQAGLSVDEYIKQSRLVVHNNALVTEGNALFQDRVNPLSPIWTSKLYDELAIPGRLPKEMTGAQALEVVSRLQNGGKFKAEEVEWTGVAEWLEGQERVTAEEVLNFIQNNGVQVMTIMAADEVALPREVEGPALEWFTQQHELRQQVRQQLVAEARATERMVFYKDLPPDIRATVDGQFRTSRVPPTSETPFYIYDLPDQPNFWMLGEAATDETLSDYIDDPLAPSDIYTEEDGRLSMDDPAQQLEALRRLYSNRDLEQIRALGLPRDVELSIYRAWENPDAVVQKARYSMFTVGKGERYREILLTLPRRPTPADRDAAYQTFVFNMERKYGDGFVAQLTKAEQAEYRRLSERADPANDSKFPKDYHSSHWTNIDNPLAHIRVDDRTLPDGRRVLFVNEVQSDWHQAGREAGYKGTESDTDWKIRNILRSQLAYRWEDIPAQYRENIEGLVGEMPGETVYIYPEYMVDDGHRGQAPFFTIGQPATRGLIIEANADMFTGQQLTAVPNAPFKNTWSDLALKRILRLAVDEGYDGIMLTNGEAIAQKVGATSEKQLEGNRHFYDNVLRGKLEKLSGEKGEVMGIPNYAGVEPVVNITEENGQWHVEVTDPGDPYGMPLADEYFATEREARMMVKEEFPPLPETDTGFVVPLTDKTKQKVYSGQPLFQGQNGAFQQMENGLKLISIFEKGNVTTVAHELAHFADHMLPADVQAKLYEAMGHDITDGINVNAREGFAQTIERMLHDGNLEIKGLERETKLLKDWMRQVYGTLIPTDGLGPKVSEEVVEAFNKNLFNEKFVREASTAPKAGRWDKFWDTFSVTRPFERAGAQRTGNSLRLFFTEAEAPIDEAAQLLGRIKKLAGGDERTLTELVLAYERGEIGADYPPAAQAAMDLFREFMDRSLRDYRKYGGLQEGYIDRLHRDLDYRLGEVLAGTVLPDEINRRLAEGDITAEELQPYVSNESADVAEALIKLRARIDDAPVNYVHVPYFWFSEKISTNPKAARKLLRVLADKPRTVFSLNELVKNEIVDVDEIKVSDLLASYAHRLGHDLALLKVREAATLDGQARRKLGASPSEGWMDPNQPIFKGYEVTPALHNWIEQVSGKQSMGAWGWFARNLKLLSFFDPFIMTGYNFIQLGLGLSKGMATDPVGASGAVARGFQSWLKGDQNYWAFVHAGLNSTPFSISWIDAQRKMASVESPLWRRAILGAAVGGAAGSVVPGFGTLSGALYGAAGFASSPDRFLKAGAQAWERARDADARVSGALMRTLYETNVNAFRNMYEAGWEITWGMDQMLRMTLAQTYFEQGMTREEAAREASEVFGDYASIPLKTRQFLNTFMYTPTYMIAMSRLYKHSVESSIRLMSGTGNTIDQHKAGVIIGTMGVLFAADFLATSLFGWERDQFGKRYYRRVTDTRENQANPGQDRELVAVFSGPHEVVTRHFERLMRATTEPTDLNPLARWAELNRWTLNPALNVMLDLFIRNEDEHGNPLRWRMEDDWRGYQRLSKYALLNSVQILRPLLGEEFDADASELFSSQFGSWASFASGTILFRYARTPREIALTKQYMYVASQLTGYRQRVVDEYMRGGMTQERFEEVTSDRYMREIMRNTYEQLDQIDRDIEMHYWSESVSRSLQVGEEIDVIPTPQDAGALFTPEELRENPGLMPTPREAEPVE